MKDAIKVYESLARPPKHALRTIEAGKLKGKTDINPQWRYKVMTEKFGLVGIGWKYEVQKLWTEQGAGNERLAFAQVAVFVKDGETWSEPIVGIGGSRLVALEKGTAVSNDEGYKMAVTDAFSTALKMIGVAADIYAGRWDGTKYKDAPQDNAQKPPASAPNPPAAQKPAAKKSEYSFSEAEAKEMQVMFGSGLFPPEEQEMIRNSLRKHESTANEVLWATRRKYAVRAKAQAEEVAEEIPAEVESGASEAFDNVPPASDEQQPIF